MPTRTGEPTARELLQALAGREVSARELAERYLARIEDVNGALNAAVHVDPETTLAEADDADRARRSPSGTASSSPRSSP